MHLLGRLTSISPDCIPTFTNLCFSISPVQLTLHVCTIELLDQRDEHIMRDGSGISTSRSCSTSEPAAIIAESDTLVCLHLVAKQS